MGMRAPPELVMDFSSQLEIIPQLSANALISGSIYALAAIGLSLTYGLLRVMNFAHGHFMMLGAYIYYMFSVQMQYGIFASAIFTAVVVSLLALIMLRVFITPFLTVSFVLTFVTTLCLSSILEAIVSMIFGVNVKSLSPGSAAESYEWYGVYITPMQLIIIASAIILLTVAAIIIHSSSYGRRVRALAEYPYAATAIGVSQKAVSRTVFVVGTLLAAYAGILVGYETNMQPTMGTSYTIKAFAAMILGGLGNVWGTVVGSYLLGFVENFSIGLEFGSYSLPAGYKDAFAFMIILFMLLVKPEGIFSRRRRKT
jgi:branched-chain amino acid transport system permease protein